MRLVAAALIGAAAMAAMAASWAPGRAAEERPEVEEFARAVDVEDWSYDRLYASGWRARRLLGAEVRGGKGEVVGEVEDLAVEPNGTLEGIVVQAGGILKEIGETEFQVPWRQVEVQQAMSVVSVPVTEENVDDFNLADLIPLDQGDEPVEEARVEPDRWGATELIDTYVGAPGVTEYGRVEDLVFGDGKLMAVVVSPDDTIDEGGPYAFPYLPDAYDPVTNAYTVPYTPEESARLKPFDYGALEGDASK